MAVALKSLCFYDGKGIDEHEMELFSQCHGAVDIDSWGRHTGVCSICDVPAEFSLVCLNCDEEIIL